MDTSPTRKTKKTRKMTNNNISKAFLDAFYNNFIPSFSTACGYVLGGMSCAMFLKEINDRIYLARHKKSISKKEVFFRGDGKLSEGEEGSIDIASMIEKHLESFEPVEGPSWDEE